MPDFVVVAENDSDARMAFMLANRVFTEEGPSWLDEAFFPQWIDLHGNGHPTEVLGSVPPPKCTLWTSLDDEQFDGKFLRSLRRDLSGRGKGFDYARAHKAKMLFIQLRKRQSVDALILVRDLDSKHPDERRASLEKVQSESSNITIVLAIPFPNQEAWILNLFEPTENEKSVLAELRQELGFDPCHKAEQLTGENETAKRSSKRVVKAITDNSRERKELCWTTTQFSILDNERGRRTNLRSYLNEVRKHLLPMLDPTLANRKTQT